MTNKQRSKMNMFENMSLFFNKYETTLIAFAPLWLIVQQFFEKMTAIDSLLQLQQTDTAGETKNKLSLLKIMSDSILPLARKARVWAKQQKDAVMEQLFDITETDMIYPNLHTVILARNILAGLNKYANELLVFNITAQNLSDAGSAIDEFEGSIGLPAQAQNVSKSGTKGLEQIIKDSMDQLYDCDDLIISEFKLTQPAMIIEYQNNRFIGKSVTRHTTLITHIFADAEKKEPLMGAMIKVSGYKYTAESDIEGTALLEKFKGGKLSVTVSAEGYADSVIPFTIKTGKHLDIDIVMVANKPLQQQS